MSEFKKFFLPSYIKLSPLTGIKFDIRNQEIIEFFDENVKVGKFVNYIDNEGKYIIDMEKREISIEFEKQFKFKVLFDLIKKITFLMWTFMSIKPSQNSLSHYRLSQNHSFIQLKFQLQDSEDSSIKRIKHLSMYITCINPKPEYGMYLPQH